MGQRVDYRPKKKLNKKVKIALIILAVIIVLYFVARSAIRAYKIEIEDETSTSTFKYDVSEYESLEELLNGYECKYISETRTSSLLKVYVVFGRDLYTDDESNENYFNSIIYAIVKYEGYITFELVDETRDIDIVVTCEDSAIVQIEINGDINYYLNQDSIRNLEQESSEITDFEIQSEELQALIDNSWSVTNLDLGTKDSTCNDYDIYFDEGFKLKVVGRKIYNLIFTNKYDGEIAGGLNANSTAEEVIETLGEPTFEYYTNLYGYIGEDNYLFFDFTNNQVSIYPNLEMDDEDELIQLIEELNESLDIKQFAMDLTSLWIDYDIYDYDSDYVDLQYTLKGVRLVISSSSLKNGIYIYQNYDGDLSNISSLDNVYVQDSDLIFDEETERTINESLTTLEQGEFTEEEQVNKLGTKFSVRFRGELSSSEEGYKGPTFYSRDEEFPDTELEETLVISDYNWYDDYNFIYSVDDDGIYVFNCITNTNSKILDIAGDITINSAENGKIIYNETEEINVQIN